MFWSTFPIPSKRCRNHGESSGPVAMFLRSFRIKNGPFDKERFRTTLAELIERHKTGIGPDGVAEHCSIWINEDLVELANYLNYPVVAVQDADDKVGNGFTIVLRKPIG